MFLPLRRIKKKQEVRCYGYVSDEPCYIVTQPIRKANEQTKLSLFTALCSNTTLFCM